MKFYLKRQIQLLYPNNILIILSKENIKKNDYK